MGAPQPGCALPPAPLAAEPACRDEAAGDGVAPATLYRRVSGFCTTLIELRGEFEGDIDRFLIVLIVLLDDLARASQRGRKPGVGVSALSIAEITGIPRETVRRKIAGLLESGILTREGHSHYHITGGGEPPGLVGRLSRLLA